MTDDTSRQPALETAVWNPGNGLDGSMTETGPSYVNMRLGPRAPRVAIVFNGDQTWDYWARLALHAATKVWGGRGFILVPHVKGVVDPVLLQAVTVYDPDYVVLLQPTIGQYETAQPGRLRLPLDGGPTSGEARARLVEQVRDEPVDDPDGSRAREAVMSVCSPHRRRPPRDGAEQWSEHVTLLSVDSPTRPLTAVSDIPGIPARRYASAPSDWAGPLAVMVAATCGVLREPSAGAPPTLEPARQRELLRWLLHSDGVPGTPPPELLDEGPEEEPDQLVVAPAFEPTTHALTSVRTGIRPEQPILLVVGDTMNDLFHQALAPLLVTRLCGGGSRTIEIEEHDMELKPVSPTIKTPATAFTGDVYMTPIYTGTGPSRMTVALVRFTPGARSNWHSHAVGQTLHVTEGVGLVGTRDGSIERIHAGETVICPPGEEHWHGATADTFMSHLALLEAKPDGSDPTTWLEPVTAEDYEHANKH